MTAQKRHSLPLFLAGCATGAVSVMLCAILAIAANAIYWTNAMGAGPMQRGTRANTAAPREASNSAARDAVAMLPAGNAAAGAQVFESVAPSAPKSCPATSASG